MELEKTAVSPNGEMTKAERTELRGIVRARARVAKVQVDQRKAELLADFEQSVAAVYKPADHPIWGKARAAAAKAVEEADARIRQVCQELGIPDEFRPGVGISWYGRGENASLQRRTELRRVAVTRLDAQSKTAKAAIESASVEMQTTLVAGGLQSADAKAFLESMPTPKALLTPLELPELESVGLPREED